MSQSDASGKAHRVDRLTAVREQAFDPKSLVGSYFHSFEPQEEGKPRQVKGQGCVVAEPQPGIYLVETFDWIAGVSEQQLVRIEDMLAWQFYDEAEWMNAWYVDYRAQQQDDE